MSSGRVVVFDAYGTLFDLMASVRSVVGQTRDSERLAEQWRERQLEYAWVEMMTGAEPDFWAVTDRAARAVSRSTAEAEALLVAYRRVSPYSDAVSCLTQLGERGFQRVVFSNANPGMLATSVSASGLEEQLDRVESTAPSGTFKPHSHAYEYLQALIGGAPREIAFVSSNAWDVAGATAVGLSAWWINRSRTEFPYPHVSPRSEFHSLAELAEALPCAS